MNKEQELQIAVSTYIKMQYPNVIFTSESAGINLKFHQAIINKKCRSGNGLPDLWILEASNGYNGCLIELKKEGTKLFKKDGELLRDAHLFEQYNTILKLREKGYYSDFAVGFENAKKVIDNYLKKKIGISLSNI